MLYAVTRFTPYVDFFLRRLYNCGVIGVAFLAGDADGRLYVGWSSTRDGQKRVPPEELPLPLRRKFETSRPVKRIASSSYSDLFISIFLVSVTKSSYPLLIFTLDSFPREG